MLSNPEEAATNNFNYELPSLNAIEDKISILERFLSNEKSSASNLPNLEPITSDSLPYKKPSTKNPKMPPLPTHNRVPSDKILTGNINYSNTSDRNNIQNNSQTNTRSNIPNKSNVGQDYSGSNINAPPVQFTNAQIRSLNNEGDVTQSQQYNIDEKALAPKFVEIKRPKSKKKPQNIEQRQNKANGGSNRESSVKRIVKSKEIQEIGNSNKKRSISKRSKSRPKKNKANNGKFTDSNTEIVTMTKNERNSRNNQNIINKSSESLRRSAKSKNSSRKLIINPKNHKDVIKGTSNSQKKTLRKSPDNYQVYDEMESNKNVNRGYNSRIERQVTEQSAKLEKELELL